MKTVTMFFPIALLFVAVSFGNAQSDKMQRTTGIKTQTIKVYGECQMNKDALKMLSIQ